MRNWKMSGFLLVIICLLVVMILPLISSCSTTTTTTPKANPTTTAAQVQTQTPAPTQVYQLKFASWNPEVISVAKIQKQWAKMIEDNSNGRIKITMYFGETLLKQNELFRGVQTGIADMVHFPQTDSSIFNASLVTYLPFLGISSMENGTAIWWNLYNKFPEFQKDFEGLKVLNAPTMPGYHIFTVNKEVRLPADLKGMKILARGIWAETMRNMNAAPVELPATDWYTSLNTKLAEGIIQHWISITNFKLLDMIKYATIFGESKAGCQFGAGPIAMNLKTWNSLPPDLQKVIADASKWEETEIMRDDGVAVEASIKAAQAINNTFINLNAQELKAWDDAAKPVHDKWISDMTAKGLPGQAIYDEAKRLIQQQPK